MSNLFPLAQRAPASLRAVDDVLCHEKSFLLLQKLQLLENPENVKTTF